MHFEERNLGDYRIYVGAIEAGRGGFEACIVVHRQRGPGQLPEVVFRDERMAGAHSFSAASDALRHALAVGEKGRAEGDGAQAAGGGICGAVTGTAGPPMRCRAAAAFVVETPA